MCQLLVPQPQGLAASGAAWEWATPSLRNWLHSWCLALSSSTSEMRSVGRTEQWGEVFMQPSPCSCCRYFCCAGVWGSAVLSLTEGPGRRQWCVVALRDVWGGTLPAGCSLLPRHSFANGLHEQQISELIWLLFWRMGQERIITHCSTACYLGLII